jgi:two-component system NtrC family sensor kinase
VGIPEEIRKKIFRIGFSDWRNGQKGSGLGLYVARRNVENHNGCIMIDSEVGEGTTVTVMLPVEPDAALCELPKVQ